MQQGLDGRSQIQSNGTYDPVQTQFSGIDEGSRASMVPQLV